MLETESLSELALEVRRDILKMANAGRSSHVGSALSVADILAVLYGAIMHISPSNPKDPQRDRFILSKGHASAAGYAILAEMGFFDKEWLMTHCQNNAKLSGHIIHKGIPGVELSTGSLGHGLPVGAGLAYAAKLDEASHQVFVLMSDGECDEGSNWEAALFAGHHQLNRLTAIIDYNKLQSLCTTMETLDLEPFADKWRSFNWHVIETNGHDHSELSAAFNAAKQQDKPTCVICHTTKGKGVSFMEDKVLWHYRPPLGEEFEKAMQELGGSK